MLKYHMYFQWSNNCIIKIAANSYWNPLICLKITVLSDLHLLWHQTLNIGSDWSVCSITIEPFLEAQCHPNFYKHQKPNLSLQNSFVSNRTWAPVWCDLIDAVTSLTFGSKVRQIGNVEILPDRQTVLGYSQFTFINTGGLEVCRNIQ